MKAIAKFLFKRRRSKKKKKEKKNADVGRNPLSAKVDRKNTRKTTRTTISKSPGILHSKVQPPRSTNNFKYRKIVSNLRGTVKTASVRPKMQQEEEGLMELKYIANFLEAFQNTTEHYEQLLDQLAGRDIAGKGYGDMVEQIHEFRVSLKQSANQLNSLLLMKKSSAHKMIKQVELLRSLFKKSCKSCKETTMTFQAIVKHKNFEITEFDSFVLGQNNKANGAPRESADSVTSRKSSIGSSRSSNTNGIANNSAHAELQDAFIDFLQDAKKLGIDDKSSVGASSITDASVESDKISSNEENPDQLLEPVCSQFRKAKELMASQLVKSRADLNNRFHLFLKRDSVEKFNDICTAKELQRDGQYLMAAYNLGPLGDGLGIYGRGDTFEEIAENSLVIEPFLDFDPRSDAMKKYMRSLKTLNRGGGEGIDIKGNGEAQMCRVAKMSRPNLQSP